MTTVLAMFQGGLGALGGLLPMILIIGVFYMLLIRPQQKRQRQLQQTIAELKAGDRVVTVVSALDGMTEELLALADAAGASNHPAKDARLKEIRRRHEEIAKAAGEPGLVAPLLDQLDHLALGISAVGELTARSKDAVTAYGEEGARPVTGDANDAADALARLDAALVKEQGDSATVGATEGDAGVSLVRVDGKWKFPVAALIKNADEAAVAQRLSDVEAQVGLFTEAAAEVKQGKYKTGDEVRQALDQRILQMVMQQKRPTTAPTTATSGAATP